MLVPPNATIEAGARERRAVPRWDSTGPGHRGLPRIGVNNEQSPSSCILNNMSMARSLGQRGAGLRGAAGPCAVRLHNATRWPRTSATAPRPGIADCVAACGGSAKSRVCSSVSRRGPRCTNYVARRDYTVRVTKSAKNDGLTLIRENDKNKAIYKDRAFACSCIYVRLSSYLDLVIAPARPS